MSHQICHFGREMHVGFYVTFSQPMLFDLSSNSYNLKIYSQFNFKLFSGAGETGSMYVQSQDVCWYVHEGLAYMSRTKPKD